jgi:RimJ/RimL family protein N-acetyltransferase
MFREVIARLGAKQDGVLRSHTRTSDGALRDTVVFSVLEHEWPMVRNGLEARLARPR